MKRNLNFEVNCLEFELTEQTFAQLMILFHIQEYLYASYRCYVSVRLSFVFPSFLKSAMFSLND